MVAWLALNLSDPHRGRERRCRRRRTPPSWQRCRNRSLIRTRSSPAAGQSFTECSRPGCVMPHVNTSGWT